MAKTRREIELEIKSLELQKEANKADFEALKRLDKKIIAQERLLGIRKQEEDLAKQTLNFEKKLLKDLENQRFKDLRAAGLDVDKSREALATINRTLEKKRNRTDEEEAALKSVNRIRNLEESIRESVIEQSDAAMDFEEIQRE